MHKSYTFHNDPGHGWLEVPKSDLEQIGVTEQITPFSYQDEQNAYLEEDLDADVFIKAAKIAGWQLELKDRYVSGSCFVQELPSYQG
jgi:hypothetical protein